ncbi:phage portal protein [Acetobacterium sp.]|uniref:phage portal protein n=1 Tax=Acetobacterium sp. TaxID=1872094 RepID=UPI00271EE715|nr:phage portal protein [Acetobacterium sp.]MDO9490797.1 phage portal protein [Acetobacterium sp.]
MNKISLLDFLKKPKPPETETRTEIITDIGGFSPWSGDAYSNDIYRAAIDAISRNAAKLKGSHVITYGDHNKVDGDCKINRLLQIQPNPYMAAYDLWYKMTTHLFLYNNAFAYLQKSDRGKLLGIYPMRPQHIDFLSDSTGAIYCKMLFSNGKDYLFPYADIIHLRRHFNDNDLLGDPNGAIMPALELAHTQNEGLVNSIQSSANIRGILQFTGQLAGPKLKEKKEEFINDYMGISNNGGIAMLDTTMEYTPIDSKPVNIDDAQIKAIKTKIYDYLGVSETIINSSYNEDQFSAFYESTLEPIAVQLSLEFTRKLFNDREQSFGNSIMFESGRLQFSSNATKVNLIKELMPMGLLSINQALEILNLPSVEGGDQRLQSLNYVNSDKADQYQLNEKETITK